VVSIVCALVSTILVVSGAGVGAGATVVVVSVVSFLSLLLLHAAKEIAINAIANTFFILDFFEVVKYFKGLIPDGLKGNLLTRSFFQKKRGWSLRISPFSLHFKALAYFFFIFVVSVSTVFLIVVSPGLCTVVSMSVTFVTVSPDLVTVVVVSLFSSPFPLLLQAARERVITAIASTFFICFVFKK
jgi:hypothetical protein